MTPIDRILGSLEQYKPAGQGKWKARCPAHDDRTPSLQITEGEGGAVLLHCFGGCRPDDVVGALGLSMSDLFPPKSSTSKGSGTDQFRARDRKVKPAASDPKDAQEKKPPLFTLIRADKIELKPTDWIIRDFLVADTLAGLIAPPGTCKSFLAIDWACRIATGTAWNGRDVKQGAVFYLAGEGQRGLRKRIDGWQKHTGTSIAGAPLYIASSLPFLCDAVNADETVSIIDDVADELFFNNNGVEPVLVVIDTVARAMNGANENSTEDMGQLIAAFDKLRHKWGCTVLSVHHTGVDPNSQTRGRGSSNYAASLDSDFFMSTQGDGVKLAPGTKAKDWRKPPALLLTKLEVEVQVPGDDGELVAESTLVLHDVAGALVETSERDRVYQLAERGLSQRDIAKETGIPKTTVQRWLKDAA